MRVYKNVQGQYRRGKVSSLFMVFQIPGLRAGTQLHGQSRQMRIASCQHTDRGWEREEGGRRTIVSTDVPAKRCFLGEDIRDIREREDKAGRAGEICPSARPRNGRRKQNLARAYKRTDKQEGKGWGQG